MAGEGQYFRTTAFQDTGNPVLDSTINAVTSGVHIPPGPIADALRAVHAVILELAAKEPGGLKVRSTNGAAVRQE
jgi:hypothetical protein